jgi:protoporphyrinogen/coproporphyrinogen III oxidase
VSGRAVVIGAGIAGLGAAHRLAQAGYEVRVLEATSGPGGRMSTITRDGYVIDRGAGSLTTRYQELMGLVKELGIGHDLVEYPDVIGIWRGGQVHRLRDRAPIDAIRTKLVSTRSKLIGTRLALDSRRVKDRLDPQDLSKLKGVDNESLRAYCDRRLTPDLRDFVIEPTMRFLYGGGLEDFASSELFFILSRYLGGSMMTARSGIDFLVRALAGRLDVQYDARATSVEEGAGGVTVTWERDGTGETIEHAEVCVIAITAAQMQEIYSQLGAERRAIVDSLVYNQLWKIALGVHPAPSEPATFVQVPSVEDPVMSGVILEHNKRAGRAPAGKGLLSVYGSAGFYAANAEASDERVVEQLAARLNRIIPGVDATVEFFNVERWDPGLLMAGPGTWTRIARFHALTPPTARVQFAGDYIGGSVTNSALASGMRAARIITSAARAAA